MNRHKFEPFDLSVVILRGKILGKLQVEYKFSLRKYPSLGFEEEPGKGN